MIFSAKIVMIGYEITNQMYLTPLFQLKVRLHAISF